jgi:hypothetical protein
MHGSEEKRIQNYGRKSQGSRPLGRPGDDVRIILKCIFVKTHEGYRVDSSDLGQRPVAGSCEHGNLIWVP